MNAHDARSLLLEIFHRLRRSGFSLGIGELLAAFQAVDGGWGANGPEALRELSRLLWCNSPQEAAEFEEVYETTLTATARSASQTSSGKSPTELKPPLPEEQSPEMSPREVPKIEPMARRNDFAVFPVRSSFQPPPSEAGVELRTYWPVSRRYMLYTWRYLRRPVKDGPWDVLNVEATIEHSARQGFFLCPVYDRRESNHAHLILMLDQGGSMIPFHRFTRDIVETASEESTIRQVEVVYFHNVPPPTVFSDPFLTEPLLLEQILEGCTPDSSVLLVSDAGAARGYRSTSRIRTTTDFIVKLKQRTTLIAWLNPMPQHRWKGTSAQFIARLVPMFQMDRDGFSNAVDVLRGQPLQAYR